MSEKITKPCRVGGVTFQIGVSVDTVIKASQRLYERQLNNPENPQTEINELKQKLARYENPDYVLVPRTPNKKMLKEMESGYYFEQGWSHYFGEEAYERMLKAVEKEHD